MATGLEIKNLIQSQAYKKLLDKAKYDYEINIYDDDDCISQECNAVADEMNKSGLELEAVFNFIVENSELVIHFSEIKIAKLSGDYCDFDENDNEIVSLGQSKTFLITNAIEILLMKQSEADLINFLKAIKIPSHKKYAKELIGFYQDSLGIH